MALGDLYFHGRGVQYNYGVAVECHTKAANQGDVAL
jgi:TPR repeat protein